MTCTYRVCTYERPSRKQRAHKYFRANQAHVLELDSPGLSSTYCTRPYFCKKNKNVIKPLKWFMIIIQTIQQIIINKKTWLYAHMYLFQCKFIKCLPKNCSQKLYCMEYGVLLYSVNIIGYLRLKRSRTQISPEPVFNFIYTLIKNIINIMCY